MAGSSENAEALLQWGADPSVPEKSANVTCLHWIFCFPSDRIVVLARLLVQHGTDINALAVRATPSFHYPFWFSAGTPFHWAVLVGCYSAMQSLYNLGTDASIRDTSDPYRYLLDVRLETEFGGPDNTAYSVPRQQTMVLNVVDVAALAHDHLVLGFFIKHGLRSRDLGADEEGYFPFHRLNDGDTGYTSSGIAFRTTLFRGDPKDQRHALLHTIQALQKLGFDINALTSPQDPLVQGRSPLMQAVSAGKIDVVTALLEQEDSIDLNIANEVRKTALMSLSTRMTANDFDLHKTTTEIVKLLLATGKIDIHATDIDGDTALLGAAAGGHFQVSLILLENGADICSSQQSSTSRSRHERRCLSPQKRNVCRPGQFGATRILGNHP